jgi:hypothetical protein
LNVNGTPAPATNVLSLQVENPPQLAVLNLITPAEAKTGTTSVKTAAPMNVRNLMRAPPVAQRSNTDSTSTRSIDWAFVRRRSSNVQQPLPSWIKVSVEGE